MADHRVTLIPGDDSGPELIAAVLPVLEAALSACGSSIVWEVHLAGSAAVERHGTPLPTATLESIRRNRVALKGPLTTPIGSGFRSVNIALRRGLDLYACVRPCRLLPGIASRFPVVDITVIRENTEDFYCGIEFAGGHRETRELLAGYGLPPDAGISGKMISEAAARRISGFAFDYAIRMSRAKVTCVTRADVLPETDGLFAAAFRATAADYPQIQTEDLLLGEVCSSLVGDPGRFDMLVLPNLYGDIISDLTAGLIGGLGVAPSANVGARHAVFEATHGSAPQFRGTGKLNPVALIQAGAMLLDHLGEDQARLLVETALASVLRTGTARTFDLAGALPPVGTTEFAREVIRNLPVDRGDDGINTSSRSR